jgi:hypothetical protein
MCGALEIRTTVGPSSAAHCLAKAAGTPPRRRFGSASWCDPPAVSHRFAQDLMRLPDPVRVFKSLT